MTEQADLWWDTQKCQLDQEFGFSWEQLKGKVRAKFYPDFLRRQKEQEFVNLSQGSMSVVEYAAKFMELARFAPDLIPNDKKRMEWFENGLDPNPRKQLATFSADSHQTLYDRATHVEGINRMVDDKANNHQGNSHRPNWKQRVPEYKAATHQDRKGKRPY